MIETLSRRKVALRPLLETLEGRRLLSEGGLDPSFGMGGRTQLLIRPADPDGLTEYEQALGVAVQADGKIIVVGQAFTFNNHNGYGIPSLAIARLLPDGTPESSFGSGGTVVVPLDETYGTPSLTHAGIALHDDGKIDVACGVVVRLNPNGTFDASFGVGGIASFPTTVTVRVPPGFPTGPLPPFLTNLDDSPSFTALDCQLQPDGRLIVVGLKNNSHESRWVYRLNPDGSLDPNYSINNYIGNNPLLSGQYSAMVLQPDGHLVLAGTIASEVPLVRDFALTRVASDGMIVRDGTADLRGEITFPFKSPHPDWQQQATAIATQPDGKVIIAGMTDILPLTFSGPFGRPSIARINADGSLDTSFNGTGTLLLPLGVGVTDTAIVGAVSVLEDGRIMVAGSVEIGSTGGQGSEIAGFALRLQANGSPDPSFGEGGKSVFFFDTSALSPLGGTFITRVDSIRAMAIQSDGRIVLAGDWYHPSSKIGSSFGLARLSASIPPIVVKVSLGDGGGNGGGGGAGGGGGGAGDVGRTVSVPPSFVSERRLTTGKGRKKKISGFQINFSAPLDPVVAEDLAHYEVTQPGRNKRDSSVRKRIPVRSARFNSLDNSVTLTLGKYDAKKPLAMTARGLVGAQGTPAATIVANL